MKISKRVDEIIIGCVLIASGLFVIGFIAQWLISLDQWSFDFLFKENGETVYSKLIKSFIYPALITALSIGSGIGLMLKKIWGWTTAVSALVVNSLLLVILIIIDFGLSNDIYLDYKLLGIFVVLVFTVFLIDLLLPEFRARYRPQSKHWFILASIPVILISWPFIVTFISHY